MLEHNIINSFKSLLEEKALFLKKNIGKKDILKDENFRLLNIAIVKDGKILQQKGAITLKEIVPYLNKENSFNVFEDEEFFNLLYTLPIDDKMTIALFWHHIPNKAEDVEETLWVLDPILFLLLLFLVSKLIDKILIPIKNITNTANEISISDFSKSIELPQSENELKDLVSSFNKMIARIKEGVLNIEQFNNDVSHELKTPLTVIKGEVEVTLDRPRKPKEYIKSLKVIEEEATHIESIVNELLLLSRYTSSTIPQSFEICHLENILFETIRTYTPKAKQKNISLHVKQTHPFTLKANALLIKTIFSNLLDNAIKYSLEGKNVFLSLYLEDEKINFLIEDEGIGIPQNKLPFITQRFYRVDDSRNKRTKGFGLGLAIVKNAVFLHNATLHVTSSEKIGTTIRITF
jgi:signal transduction histidine kinase